MRAYVGTLLLVVIALDATALATEDNLFPNGDAESEWVNLVFGDKGFARHIQARDTGMPSFWRLAEGAALSRDERHVGQSAVRLPAAVKPVSATVFSDYWRVKDGAMPFGAPLLPGVPVDVSFFYKTSGALKDGALGATVTLGVIAGLASDTRDIPLPPSPDWREVSVAMTPAELRWGAQIAFTLNEGQEDGQAAWIDDARATQDVGDKLNLVRNPGFEAAPEQAGLPPSWERPIEDQWVSWVGARYREPRADSTIAASGWRSMRITATYAEVSGLSQEIRLDQDRSRPVIIGLRSKLDNSVGSAPPGYYGPDNLANLTVYVYHTDGTMQEVSPTFCLGESDHDWSYTRAGFMPQKPVERIRLQISLIGMESTTSLWVDDVSVFELGDAQPSSPPLPSARLAPARTLLSSWATQPETKGNRIAAANDSERLYLTIPRVAGSRSTLVYLSPSAGEDFPNYHRFLYSVIRIGEDGGFELGTTVEKQGYTAAGEFVDAASAGLTLQTSPDASAISIPFLAIRAEGPSPASLGFNVQWDTPDGPRYWTGRSANTGQLGTLVTAPPPGVVVRSVRFGDRWDREPDMSQDFVTHPQMNAGRNKAEFVLTNHGEATRIEWTAGVQGMAMSAGACALAAGETQTIGIDYDAGTGGGFADFDLSLRDSKRVGAVTTSYPLEIPRAIELALDQEFYFPEETTAKLEVHNRLRPLAEYESMHATLNEVGSNAVLWSKDVPATQPVTVIEVPLDAARINDLPVQDYEVRVSLQDRDGNSVAAERRPFGRIRHTQKRPIPPIRKLEVDDKGRLIVNDDFRFFPIIPSVQVDGQVEAVQLGANAYRANFVEGKNATEKGLDIFEAVDEAWNANAYTITIGPAPDTMALFDKEGERLLAHPGFLGCYGKQFYYWNLPDDCIAYRHRLESIVGAAPVPKLVVWGHHDSSFLYDLGRTGVAQSEAPLGYCYVKIMGRPGPTWRNAPFLTRTEQVLDPHKLKLAEVNYYVAFHDDEVVPEHFRTYRSMRADDWHGVRNESYLSVIYGANGLYHWICVQKGGLQRLRGWFQELNYMWPIFASDDGDKRVAVSPANSGIEARLKQWNGTYYLLTANANETPREARIAIEGLDGMRVRKLFDLPGSIAVEGNTIEDNWNQYDAFVYELTEAKP